jgi:hypothetical protein
MSHCRWVVVAEDCFDQLQQLNGKTLEKSIESDKVFEEPTVKSVGTGVPDVEEKANPAPEKPSEETFAEPLVEPPKQPHSDWTDSLPPSFRKEGSKLLESLQTNGLVVSDSGVLSIEGEDIEGYSVETFLRTTCVPFHKGSIPLKLQNWLRSKDKTKFRNHLATIRPAWKKRYSLRKSTMETR